MEASKEIRGLRREVTQLKWCVGGLVAGVLVLGILGAGGSVHRELTVRKLTLIDEEGRSRVVLFAKANDMAGAAFLDPEGRNRIEIATAIGKNGDYAGIQLRDSNGVHRIDLKVREGAAFAGLGDAAGNAVSHWKSDPNEKAGR